MSTGSADLPSLLAHRVLSAPDALAFADEHDRHLTFAQFERAVRDVAAALADRGIGPGSTVAWQLPTWIESFVLAGALAWLGAVQVPILPIAGPRDLEHAVRTTGAELLVVPEDFRDRPLAAQARDALAALPVELLVLADRRLPTADHAPPDPAPGHDGVRWIFHTSGTTSAPKGALHTDASVLAAARAYAHSARITPTDRNGVVFSITHIGGVQLLFLALDTGAANVLVEHFDAEQAVALFERERVTLAGAGPVFHRAYLEVQRRTPGVRILPDVRAFTSGGAPKSVALHDELRREIGAGILSNYGMTECPNLTGNTPGSPDEKLATTEGRANPGVVFERRAADGHSLVVDGPGELWVRAPQLCAGYLDPAMTADAFDDRGFLRTGDLGEIDDDGYVRIVGRVKDVIIRKGENISAREVEELLELDPAVADVAVLGLPDPELGERCCAVVVAADPAAPPTLGELTAALRARGLTPQKLPEQLEIVAALPRNASGKILKPEILASLGERSPVGGS